MFKSFINLVKIKVFGISVMQDWTLKLTPKEQTTLISSIRGTDKNNGECKDSKNITRMLRYVILNDADKKTSFMSDFVVKQHIVSDFLIKEFSSNIHWVEHIIFSGFIIAKHHPNTYTRDYWRSVSGKVRFNINKQKKKMKDAEDKIRLSEQKKLEVQSDVIADNYMNLYGNGYM